MKGKEMKKRFVRGYKRRLKLVLKSKLSGQIVREIPETTHVKESRSLLFEDLNRSTYLCRPSKSSDTLSVCECKKVTQREYKQT